MLQRLALVVICTGPLLGCEASTASERCAGIDYGDPVAATIEWSSSDDRIATVTTNGIVRGRQAGDAVITARVPARNLVGSREVAVWVRGGGGP